MKRFHIRQATSTDVQAMGNVMVATWLQAHKGQIPEGQWQQRKRHWTAAKSAEGWATLLADIAQGTNQDSCVFVAVADNDAVIGIALGNPANVGILAGAGEISSLYVNHNYQRMGVGREMVRVVAETLLGSGCEALTISVLETNTPARRFYESLGGVVIGTLETEDFGYREPQVIYGWPDIRVLTVS